MKKLFQKGKRHNRGDIHVQFGGSRQSGISPSATHPLIFLFSGKSGEYYGYEDGWQPSENIFLYTGEGQVGNMDFTRGNKAVRDHVENGKELHLFLSQGKGRPVEYAGEFECASYDFYRGQDRNGNERRTIRFHLLLVDGSGEEHFVQASEKELYEHDGNKPLEELRTQAISAAAPHKATEWRSAAQRRRQRGADVREYVLRRAAGKCELTGEPAPFSRTDGTPYLEVHHIKRLSDEGLDHPFNCAAVTPNAHREIHFGAVGAELDEYLLERIREKEKVRGGQI